jgi:hypothetical protein
MPSRKVRLSQAETAETVHRLYQVRKEDEPEPKEVGNRITTQRVDEMLMRLSKNPHRGKTDATPRPHGPDADTVYIGGMNDRKMTEYDPKMDGNLTLFWARKGYVTAQPRPKLPAIKSSPRASRRSPHPAPVAEDGEARSPPAAACANDEKPKEQYVQGGKTKPSGRKAPVPSRKQKSNEPAPKARRQPVPPSAPKKDAAARPPPSASRQSPPAAQNEAASQQSRPAQSPPPPRQHPHKPPAASPAAKAPSAPQKKIAPAKPPAQHDVTPGPKSTRATTAPTEKKEAKPGRPPSQPAPQATQPRKEQQEQSKQEPPASCTQGRHSVHDEEYESLSDANDSTLRRSPPAPPPEDKPTAHSPASSRASSGRRSYTSDHYSSEHYTSDTPRTAHTEPSPRKASEPSSPARDGGSPAQEDKGAPSAGTELAAPSEPASPSVNDSHNYSSSFQDASPVASPEASPAASQRRERNDDAALVAEHPQKTEEATVPEAAPAATTESAPAAEAHGGDSAVEGSGAQSTTAGRGDPVTTAAASTGESTGAVQEEGAAPASEVPRSAATPPAPATAEHLDDPLHSSTGPSPKPHAQRVAPPSDRQSIISSRASSIVDEERSRRRKEEKRRMRQRQLRLDVITKFFGAEAEVNWFQIGAGDAPERSLTYLSIGSPNVIVCPSHEPEAHQWALYVDSVGYVQVQLAAAPHLVLTVTPDGVASVHPAAQHEVSDADAASGALPSDHDAATAVQWFEIVELSNNHFALESVARAGHLLEAALDQEVSSMLLVPDAESSSFCELVVTASDPPHPDSPIYGRASQTPRQTDVDDGERSTSRRPTVTEL